MKGLDYYMDGLLDEYLNQPENEMKTYQIELQSISYTRVCVEATSQEEAEALAMEKIQRGEYTCNDGAWDIDSIEELT